MRSPDLPQALGSVSFISAHRDCGQLDSSTRNETWVVDPIKIRLMLLHSSSDPRPKLNARYRKTHVIPNALRNIGLNHRL